MKVVIDGRDFRDQHGRILTLRGVNLGGDAKNPCNPHMPSHVRKGLFDADDVSFVGAPFPVAEADDHLARIKGYGFNVVRFVFTWEALEHAGPGKYDDEYIDYVIHVLRKCKEHGLLVFMDPHQDTWSRFSGGSGAPLWTLAAAGLNPENFHATEGAFLQSLWPDPAKFPFMLWSSNYKHRFVCYTMFTLFFSGRDFAPRAIINDMNIQDFLQNAYLNAIKYFASRIYAADGNLGDSTIIAWETFNEPHYGFTGNQNLAKLMPNQQIRLGTVPTGFQAIRLASGMSETVDYYEFGQFGPSKRGTRVVDPQGVKVWAELDETKYGWKRSPDWDLGTCLWAQHGVWDRETGELLQSDYFAKTPDGEVITDEVWMQRCFLPHVKRYIEMIREFDKETMLFLQPPVWFIPPKVDPSSLGGNVVYTPHFYDGLTLMQKKWRWWNVDALGYMRGKYLTPIQALRFGATAIRNCFRDQLKAMRQEGLDAMGDTPCLLSEIGIPYDMDSKKAFNTGKYINQYAAMDANNFALEGAGLNYTLWCYCHDNSHGWGDLWNGEDLAIWSKDDESPRPPNPFDAERIVNIEHKPGDPYTRHQSVHDETRHGDEPIPTDLAFSFPHKMRLENGSRAMEAFVRPSPIVTVGTATSYTFDLATCTFEMTVTAAPSDMPTEIFLPDYFFRGGAEPEVSVSSGRWTVVRPVQVLRWWHETSGEQKLRIMSGYRHTGMEESVDDSDFYIGMWVVKLFKTKCTIL